VGELVLAEVVYAPGQRIPRHVHPHARFVLVLTGSITELRAAESRMYTPSTLLFRSAEEPHAYVVAKSGATCLVVDVEAAWFARARQHASLLEHSAGFRGGLLLHLAHRLYGEFRLRDEVSRLVIESLMLGIVAEASRSAAREAAQPAPPWLTRARALVDRHFAEPLPLAAVARRVGVHPVHLARSFRRVYQTTFGAYVRQTRIEFARAALAGSEGNLSAIAAAAGFCDQSHFSRCFKRYTGLTPAEYRFALQTR